MKNFFKTFVCLTSIFVFQTVGLSQTCTYPGPNLIVNGDFEGSLAPIPGMTYTLASANTATAGTYTTCTGNIGSGQYTFANRAQKCGSSNWWAAVDHTLQDTITEKQNWNTNGTIKSTIVQPKGTFLIVDSKDGKSVAYTRTFAVCPNTVYQFSFWAKNLVRQNVPITHTNPSVNISFGTNTVVAAPYIELPFRTYFPSMNGIGTWVQTTGTYTTSSIETSLTFNILLDGTSTNGSDLGLDDISFRTCSYKVDLVSSNSIIGGTGSGCNPSVTFSANVSKEINDTKGYTFTWTPSAAINPPSSAISPSLTSNTGLVTHTVNPNPSVSTTYTVDVMRDGCLSSIQSGTLSIKVFTVTASSNVTVTCGGAANGTLSVNAVDGAAPYTYKWAGPSGVLSSTNSVASNLGSGNYSITVTGTNGCAYTVTAAVLPAPGTITTTVTSNFSVTCFGASTGSLSTTTSGGQSPYSYTWSPTGGNTVTATGLAARIYTLLVRDNVGCLGSQTVSVSQPTSALSSSIASNFSVACFGTSTGSASINASGGTSPYSYKWASNTSTLSSVTGLGVGPHTATVTDANGCSTQTTIVTVQPTASLAANITVNTPTICAGNSNGSLTVVGSGGTTPYKYVWTTSPSTVTTATGLVSGVYTVTISDANNCIATDSETIVATPLDNSTFNYSAGTFCATGADPTPTISGTSGGTFSATPNTLVINAQTGAIDLSASALTNYTVTYLTKGACPSQSVVAITITDAPKANFSYAGPYCQNGTNQTPTFNNQGSGGVFSSATGLVLTPSTGLIDLSKSTSGTYTVTNSIAASSGCAASNATATVLINPLPKVNGGADKKICVGENTNIGGASVNGDTYNWIAIPAGFTSTLSAISVQPTITTTYSLTQTTTLTGCKNSGTVTVIVNSRPIVDVTNLIFENAKCGKINGFIKGVSVNLGTDPKSFKWTNELNAIVGTDLNLSPIGPGTYSLNIVDANGCSPLLPIPALTISTTASVSASFTSSTLSGQKPLDVNFTNTSIGAVNYKWKFSSKDSLLTKDAKYLYTQIGSFKTCLFIDNGINCFDTACTTIEVSENSFLIVPNIFTPNGDGANDIFKVRSLGLKTLNVTIFDRWGLKMYEYNTIEGGWDGKTPNGNNASDGTYFYIITAIGTDGKVYPEEGKNLTGSFSLIR